MVTYQEAYDQIKGAGVVRVTAVLRKKYFGEDSAKTLSDRGTLTQEHMAEIILDLAEKGEPRAPATNDWLSELSIPGGGE